MDSRILEKDEKFQAIYGELREKWKLVAFKSFTVAQEIMDTGFNYACTGYEPTDEDTKRAALLIDSLLVKAFVAGKKSRKESHA